MSEVQTLVSEEDVRAKIIVPWLVDHGFDLKQLSLEYSFCIRLGRAVFRVENGSLKKPSCSANDSAYSIFRPRADVLVRNTEGKNLFVIEVKASGEPLDTDARDQGICYARLLLDGNIAPFVVLTNGHETKVFDSITTEPIDGRKLSWNHPRFMTGFCIGAEGLALREEALQTLISLSPSNLVAFCEAQSAFRMRPLRSDDLNSGKKYIPSLHVEREDAKAELRRLLDEGQRRVVVVVGPPQVGKTSFICHAVEERLELGAPCLFYPAIGIRSRLLDEIAEDFEWVLGDANESPRIIHRKLTNILRRAGKRLVIFIDGWNEANLTLARIIDRESERLSCDEIQIVVSLTQVAAGRLLGGEGGNPSFLADAASIPRLAAQRIEIDPEASSNPSSWSIVNVKRFSAEERERAYATYSQGYKVKVPDTHGHVDEPYSLSIAMRLFQNDTLPDTLDEPDLLEKILTDKANRAVGLDRYDIRVSLYELAKEMVTNGAPVSVSRVSTLWKTPLVERIPNGFFEAALLAQVTNEHSVPSLDFYFGRERDYVISYWVERWAERLRQHCDLSSRFVAATRSNAGSDALRWFFKQPRHIELIRLKDGSLPKFNDAAVRRILVSSLCDIAARSPEQPRDWVEFATDLATSDKDSLVRIEAAKLVALLAEDAEVLAAILEDRASLKDFLVAILSVGEEYPLQAESAGEVILGAVRDLHWDSAESTSDESEITDILKELLAHESRVVREGAATCFDTRPRPISS